MTEQQTAFMTWLESVPEHLAAFARIIAAWMRQQGKPLPLPPGIGGVRSFPLQSGGTIQLSEGGITSEQLDQLASEIGEATKRDMLREFVKGWVSGFMIGVGI